MNKVLMVFAALAFCATSVQASSMRCGTSSVTVDDSEVDLLRKCGQPSWVERYLTWTRYHYDCGPNKLMKIVTTRKGKIVKIETGGYGSASDAHCD